MARKSSGVRQKLYQPSFLCRSSMARKVSS